MGSPSRSEQAWLSDTHAAEFVRLLWAERKRQTLQLPPHKRSDDGGFQLKGLGAEAARLAPEAVRGVAVFSPEKHDFELVPVAAFTVEPRKESTVTVEGETTSEDDMFLLCDSPHRPAADFLEKVASVVGRLSTPRSAGAASVYVLLVAEPARLRSADPIDQQLAFGVYVGTTEQDVITRYEQHRDPTHFLRASSLDWNGVEPVAVVRLDDRFRGLALEHAQMVERDLAANLARVGLRVFGGH